MNEFDYFFSLYNVADELASPIPETSRLAYESSYNSFTEWLKDQNIKTISEKVMLSYFIKKSPFSKPTTLLCDYSKLRRMIYLKKNVDIFNFKNLVTFLKNENSSYSPIKPKAFKRAEIEKFLSEANDNQFLLIKVRKAINCDRYLSN